MARPIKTGTDQNLGEWDDRPQPGGKTGAPDATAAVADSGAPEASDAADDWSRILERPAIHEAVASVRRVSGLEGDLPVVSKARAAAPAAAAAPSAAPPPPLQRTRVPPRPQAAAAPAPSPPQRAPGPEVRRRQMRSGGADDAGPAPLPRPTPQAPVKTDQDGSPADRRTAASASWRRVNAPQPGGPPRSRPLPFLPSDPSAPRPQVAAQPAREPATGASAGKAGPRPLRPPMASGPAQEPPGHPANAARPPAADDAEFAHLVPVRRAPQPVDVRRGRVVLLPLVLILAAALGVGAGLAFTRYMFEEGVEPRDRSAAAPVAAMEALQAPREPAFRAPSPGETEPLPEVQADDPAPGVSMIRPPPAKPVRLPAAAVDGIGGPADSPAPAADDRRAGQRPEVSSASPDGSSGGEVARVTRLGDAPASGPASAVQGEVPIDAPLFLGQVFVHYSTLGDGPGDQAAAMAVSQRLEQAGYRVTDIRPVGFRIRRPNIRYFHAEDRAPAERLRRDLAVTMDPPPAVVDFTTYRPRPQAGTLEVWVESSS